MNVFLLGWVAVLTLSVVWPVLLPLPALLAIIPVSILLIRYPFVVGALLGLAYGQLHSHALTSPQRALNPGIHQLVVVVDSVPVGDALYQRTQWRVETVAGEKLPFWAANRLELGWYNGPPLALGQRYRVEAKLRDPWGSANQGGVDRRRTLLAHGVTAQGYIRSGQPLASPGHWRQSLMHQLAGLTASLPRGDLIRALVLADRRGISDERWQQLRQAGLLHLMAISGLHLSIVAGLVLWLAGQGVRRLWPDPRGRARPLAWVLAALAVLGYGTLAGFALPTQRACLSVLLGLLLLWQCRQGQPWELLLRVAAVVLLAQPLAAMSPGFWLSFGAVGLILLTAWAMPKGRPRWQNLLAIQCVLSLGLGLVQLAWFGHYSLHGVWANLLLLPYFSVLVLPVCLLAAATALLGGPNLLWLADALLSPLDWAARGAAQLGWGSGILPAGVWPLLLMALLALLLLCWRPWRGWRWQAPLLLLPGLLAFSTTAPGWQLVVIDVGQGLSVLVQRGRHGLLYDTGASGPGFSYAQSAVLPLLAARGVAQLDYLVVSHGDNDHAGGAGAIRAAFPRAQVVGHDGQPCQQGPMQWQGLNLRWAQAPLAGNDGSCVLMLSDGRHRVLLPGDIEARGERHLLAQGWPGPVSLMLAPHHGSASSSSPALVEHFAPGHVVFAAGWPNRWGFPKAEVQQRYRSQGAQLWHSGQMGQLEGEFGPDGGLSLTSFRQDRAPWWYNRQ